MVTINGIRGCSSNIKKYRLTLLLHNTNILSLNNPKYNYYIDVIYPAELEIEDTTDAPNLANYLDISIDFDKEGRLYTRL